MLGPEVKCSWLMIDVGALQPKVVWSGEATGPIPTSMALWSGHSVPSTVHVHALSLPRIYLGP